jgi:hypothetical protein
VRYWLAAAELALSRSANAEADRYVEGGLTLIPRLKDQAEGRSLELTLQLVRANALHPLKGQTAPETVEALTAAKRVIDAGVGTDLQRCSVLAGLCLARYAAAQMESALTLAKETVEIADRQADRTYRLMGYRLLGAVRLWMGQNREALKSLRHAGYQDLDPQNRLIISCRFGTDPGLVTLSLQLRALMFLGFPDRAAQVREQVRAEIPYHRHPNTVATCKLFAEVIPELLYGDLEACERHSAELIVYCTEKKIEQIRRLAAAHHACARAARQPTRENVAKIRPAIEAGHQWSGARLFDSVFISQLAQSLLAANDLTGAEAALQEGFAFVEQSGERCWLADLHRLEGQAALQRPEPDRAWAETCFLKAIETARRQEARLLELRAATDLAALRRNSAPDNDLRALLEPILNAIEGGETTRDVRNARALIAALV